jgi:hypothetical protein
MLHALALLIISAAGVVNESASAIDSFCKPMVSFAHDKRNAPRIFADLADYMKDKDSKWEAIANQRELRKHVDTERAFSQAFVWQTDQGLYVEMFFTSPTGDWAEFGDFCFRVDGSLARSISNLRTFVVETEEEDNSPVSREHRRYFDREGKRIQIRRNVRSAKTNKVIKVDFMDMEDHVFTSIRDLPFSKLLK